MLWFSSSWSINTWSRTKLSSSFCRVLSGLKTSGCRASRPPETNWWLKIINRSHSNMKACGDKTETLIFHMWMFQCALGVILFKIIIKEHQHKVTKMPLLACSLTGVFTLDRHCWQTARNDFTTLLNATRSSCPGNTYERLCHLILREHK